MSQILNTALGKRTFGQLQFSLKFLKQLKYLLDVYKMLFICLTEDQDIIEEY